MSDDRDAATLRRSESAMSGRVFHLEAEGMSPIHGASLPAVLEAIRGISVRGPSFFTLSDDSGSYVQIAGARLRLTVEYRRVTRFGFRHYVLGKPPKDETSVSINYSAGALLLKRNEILTLRDAELVFESFYTTGELPAGYVLRETTDMFADHQAPG